MPEITSLEQLQAYLRQVQECRLPEVRCTLTPAFAARITEGQLRAALDVSLPLVQGRTWQVKRSRNGGTTLISRLTYREGLRMVMGDLPVPELARVIVREAAARYSDQAERFCWLYALTARGVTYVHTAPGAKGYEHLVGAGGVLTAGQGNCQGFADTLYLLGRLAGIETDICIGPGERGFHAWNIVTLSGQSYASDASRGSRAWRSEGEEALARTCLMASSGVLLPLSLQCIQEISASACDFFHDLAGKSENPSFPTAANVL